MAQCRGTKTYVIGINENQTSPNETSLTFCTTRGCFDANVMIARDMRQGVIMLGDETSGMKGPDSIYPELANMLYRRGIASLRLNYREPGRCGSCAIDALLAMQYLDDEAVRNIALIGWSFGAAVSIGIAAIAGNVRGVAAISTIDIADCCIKRLSDKPLLLLHGERDRISPLNIARKIHSEAVGPRRLIIYPGAGHNLHEVREKVLLDLNEWACDVLSRDRIPA